MSSCLLASLAVKLVCPVAKVYAVTLDNLAVRGLLESRDLPEQTVQTVPQLV
jgi:hypothetical protein